MTRTNPFSGWGKCKDALDEAITKTTGKPLWSAGEPGAPGYEPAAAGWPAAAGTTIENGAQ